jgi:cysteinyl-tRNA synthetase
MATRKKSIQDIIDQRHRIEDLSAELQGRYERNNDEEALNRTRNREYNALTQPHYTRNIIKRSPYVRKMMAKYEEARKNKNYEDADRFYDAYRNRKYSQSTYMGKNGG